MENTISLSRYVKVSTDFWRRKIVSIVGEISQLRASREFTTLASQDKDNYGYVIRPAGRTETEEPDYVTVDVRPIPASEKVIFAHDGLRGRGEFCDVFAHLSSSLESEPDNSLGDEIMAFMAERHDSRYDEEEADDFEYIRPEAYFDLPEVPLPDDDLTSDALVANHILGFSDSDMELRSLVLTEPRSYYSAKALRGTGFARAKEPVLKLWGISVRLVMAQLRAVPSAWDSLRWGFVDRDGFRAALRAVVPFRLPARVYSRVMKLGELVSRAGRRVKGRKWSGRGERARLERVERRSARRATNGRKNRKTRLPRSGSGSGLSRNSTRTPDTAIEGVWSLLY
jgi:hypothetical protein